MAGNDVLLAVVGAGDYALEKVRSVGKVADPKVTQKLYRNLVKRGRTVSTQVKSSSATRRALAQSKAARTQVKAATTSVARAIRADAKATKSAASAAGSGSKTRTP
jgi:hypothetical protein